MLSNISLSGIGEEAGSILPHVWLAVPALFVLALCTTARGRIVVFTGGVLLTAGTSGDVGTSKIAFMGLALAISAISLLRLLRRGAGREDRRVSAILTATLVFAVAAMIAAARGFSLGAPILSIVRDGVSYLLLIAALPLAADAGRCYNYFQVRRAVLLVGLLSAAVYLANMLTTRGVANLGAWAGLLFGSFPVIALGVCLCLVEGSLGRHRGLWYIAAAGQVGAVLLTGTRMGLALFTAILGLLGRRRRGAPGVTRLIIGLALLGSFTSALVLILAPHLAGLHFLMSRLESGIRAIQGDIGEDLSGAQRLQRYELALTYFESNPVLGHGLGGFAYGTNSSSAFEYYLDTPLLVPAKFGMVGTALIVLGFAILFRGLLKPTTPRPSTQVRAQFVIRCFVCVIIFTTPFGAITENKGLGVSVALASMLVLAPAETRPRPERAKSLGGDRPQRQMS
ncbi:O-antigen ligase family protein [Pedococcus cremeus]|uniref:O-antigen ligase family protein n=1 Tax=Pedococcus cremeus TaxID=587636 RepID=UPI0015A62FC8|nr:O-antigen ligase family protein [Pedococcus cremeus]